MIKGENGDKFKVDVVMAHRELICDGCAKEIVRQQFYAFTAGTSEGEYYARQHCLRCLATLLSPRRTGLRRKR